MGRGADGRMGRRVDRRTEDMSIDQTRVERNTALNLIYILISAVEDSSKHVWAKFWDPCCSCVGKPNIRSPCQLGHHFSWWMCLEGCNICTEWMRQSPCNFAVAFVTNIFAQAARKWAYSCNRACEVILNSGRQVPMQMDKLWDSKSPVPQHTQETYPLQGTLAMVWKCCQGCCALCTWNHEAMLCR